MLPKIFRIYYSIIALVLMTFACSLPVAANSTPEAESTETPQLSVTTIPVSSTVEVISPTDTPTVTMVPTLSISKTPTLPVGVVLTETPTPTQELVTAQVMRETNCRTGPGPHYDLVATYQIGARLQVIARDLGGGFIFTQNPEKSDEQCYILENNVKISGNTDVLPQITPLASPTAAPNFSATFKKFDLCKGNVYAQFIIQNTGSVTFRSAYIKVINLRNNDSTEKVVNAFDLTTGCIIAKNIAPLDPGAIGYLSSDTFIKDPRGNKMKAIIQVCTEKNSKGTCINSVVDIKP